MHAKANQELVQVNATHAQCKYYSYVVQDHTHISVGKTSNVGVRSWEFECWMPRSKFDLLFWMPTIMFRGPRAKCRFQELSFWNAKYSEGLELWVIFIQRSLISNDRDHRKIMNTFHDPTSDSLKKCNVELTSGFEGWTQNQEHVFNCRGLNTDSYLSITEFRIIEGRRLSSYREAEVQASSHQEMKANTLRPDTP